MTNADDKIKELEMWRHEQDTKTALSKQSFANIEKRLDKIDTHINKLVWLIIASILAGVLGFIMKGGLNAGL